MLQNNTQQNQDMLPVVVYFYSKFPSFQIKFLNRILSNNCQWVLFNHFLIIMKVRWILRILTEFRLNFIRITPGYFWIDIDATKDCNDSVKNNNTYKCFKYNKVFMICLLLSSSYLLRFLLYSHVLTVCELVNVTNFVIQLLVFK